MEVLSASQLREIDQYTIDQTPISSIDLMERAASSCVAWIMKHYSMVRTCYVICGPGNNGGDGLAITRMLLKNGYQAKAILLQPAEKLIKDCATNLIRLTEMDATAILEVKSEDMLPSFAKNTFLIDAIFGTGLTRKTEGLAAAIIRKINAANLEIISIDLPSGIDSDNTSINSESEIIKTDHTLTFAFQKLAMLVGENDAYFGQIHVLEIGLLRESLQRMDIRNFVTDRSILNSIIKPKNAYSHKGNFGHSLLIAGNYGKYGAAILAARGYLRSGAGLLTLLVPEKGIPILQVAVPEAMTMMRAESNTSLPSLESFTAIGVGPGLGTENDSMELMDKLLENYKKPMVLDADALNILAQHSNWLHRLPKESILTPHPGEFKRLAGTWRNDFEKLKKQIEFAQIYQVFVILKGKNSSIACPDGKVWFNPTGNPGMAKGGSGDILTGLLTGILASGYSPFETCLLGSWLHGMAGDLAAKKLTQEGMNASDIIDNLPEAWKLLAKSKS